LHVFKHAVPDFALNLVGAVSLCAVCKQSQEAVRSQLGKRSGTAAPDSS
jgi:hypothetical protein